MSTENAARIIRQHYGLTRPVTAEEVAAELAMLHRKAAKGTLDDASEILAARLGII